MVPTVHRATIVANPDVVAFINQLEMEWLQVSKVVQPLGAILQIAMLDQYRSCRLLALGLPRLPQDVEGGEDVVVVCCHF